MKVAFAGTPEFARASLQALVQAGHQVVLVLTQPDRPSGRGMKLQPSAVKAWAQAHGLRVEQPRSLRLDGRYPQEASATQALLEELAPQVMVVAAYGLILPAWVLEQPRLGCLNVHGSLLPRWRGAAPIHRAIEAGDAQTGITIMHMDVGLDTGPMLLAQAEPVGAGDTTATVHDRLAALGARLIVQAVELAQQGQLRPQAQPDCGVTYAHKVDKAEARLDWRETAQQLERRIRAFDPFPGAGFSHQGASLKVWRAALATGVGSPGVVLPAMPGRLIVACGDGALELLELQAAGGRRLDAQAFLRGHPIPAGTCLEGA